MSSNEATAPENFIHHKITHDINQGLNNSHVITRFPPEPNGYLHIGHAKSICLNFGTAIKFNGHCNLRFDDTNPEKESVEFMNAIAEDVKWLGYSWHEVNYASDYFEQLYNFGVQLIQKGSAYVDSLSADEIRQLRGTLTEPGTESPDRNRSIEDNIALFEQMKNGEFADGSYVLRAKIDMNSPNINMRDPALYRIRRAHHPRTGNNWCLYPMYDFTHCISDGIENITHSLCTLEFEDHRPLYDWVLSQLEFPHHPQQIEFARLSLEYTIVSKRKLHLLVEQGHVSGWDDPRMPTLAGLRRAGFTPKSIRDFCERIGVTKKDSWIEMGVLEHSIREDLNTHATRRMAVLKPLRVVLENFPDNHCEHLTASNHPQNDQLGSRTLPFDKVILIEQEDFAEIPPAKFKRLILNGEVRLRNAYVIKCHDIIKNDQGDIIELRCTYDPDTLGKKPEGRKVKGVIHWVSEKHSLPAEIRLYDRLFNVPHPESEEDFTRALNPNSLQVISGAKVENSLSVTSAGKQYQFERIGYFCVDSKDSQPNQLIFNRTVTLRDTWS
ncbi:MAG TPA: glutamine--tRNA ligase/YqeY domain fusion protein [Methylococcaceae bacterium]|jgi:glutaminyl-tRNA synthetase|nr:glutamine--tRNA ligase/YqeY domain fusion protein [Methylococcaceae bacterium]